MTLFGLQAKTRPNCFFQIKLKLRVCFLNARTKKAIDFRPGFGFTQKVGRIPLTFRQSKAIGLLITSGVSQWVAIISSLDLRTTELRDIEQKKCRYRWAQSSQ